MPKRVRDEEFPAVADLEVAIGPPLTAMTSLEDTIKVFLRWLQNLKSTSGHRLMDPFNELPSRKELPMYYSKIKNPMDLRRMQQRLSSYESLAAVRADVELMFENARKFNRPQSDLRTLSTLLLSAALPQLDNLISVYDSFHPQSSRSRRRSIATLSSTPTSTGADALASPSVSGSKKNTRKHRENETVIVTGDEMRYGEVLEDWPPMGMDIDQISAYESVAIRLDKSVAQLRYLVKFKCHRCKPCQNPGWKKGCEERKDTIKKLEREYGGGRGLSDVRGSAVSHAAAGMGDGSKRAAETYRPPTGQAAHDINSRLFLAIKQHRSALSTSVGESNSDNDAAFEPYSSFLWDTPDPETHPDYLSIVPMPLSLSDIEMRLTEGIYKDDDFVDDSAALLADINIVCANARLYYPPSSRTFIAAAMLESAVVCFRRQLLIGGQLPVIAVRDLDAQQRTSTKVAIMRIWRTVDSTADSNLLGPLRSLPNAECPDYLTLVANPVDLNSIAQRVADNDYSTVSDFSDDVVLLIKNIAAVVPASDSTVRRASALLERTFVSALRMEALRDDVSSKAALERLVISRGDLVERAGVFSKMDLTMLLENLCLWRGGGDKNDSLPCQCFLVLPKRKLYPDYYHIIDHPIDITTIKEKLVRDQYTTFRNFYDDVMLMLRNALVYNHEDSQIFRDATLLRNVFVGSILEFALAKESELLGRDTNAVFNLYSTVKKDGSASIGGGSNLLLVCRSVFNSVRNDAPNGLLEPFWSLPDRAKNPEYFSELERPMSFSLINDALRQGNIDSFGHFQSKVELLCENIRVVHKENEISLKILELFKSKLPSPEDRAKLDLRQIWDAITTLSDIDTGRLLALSFFDSPLYKHSRMLQPFLSAGDTVSGVTTSAVPTIQLGLEDVRQRFLAGEYSGVDAMRTDIDRLLTSGKSRFSADSQQAADVDALRSALSVVVRKVNRKEGDAAVRFANISSEGNDGDVDINSVYCVDSVSPSPTNRVRLTQAVNAVGTFIPNDYVYIAPCKDGGRPFVGQIESIFSTDQNSDGVLVEPEVWLRVTWFHFPDATHHIVTRTFWEKEVFRTTTVRLVRVSRIVGRCLVLYSKDYFRSMAPADYCSHENTFCCESTYSERSRSFNKIKLWKNTTNIELLPRKEVLPMVRIPSIFAASDDEVVDTDTRNIRVYCKDYKKGCKYYASFEYEGTIYRLGDFVYVSSGYDELPYIAIIKHMWVDRRGNANFSGEWMVQPRGTYHPTTQTFYSNEVFKTPHQDTNSFGVILGDCSVMSLQDYAKGRKRSFFSSDREADIYICQQGYNEASRSFYPLDDFSDFTASDGDDFVYFSEPRALPPRVPSPYTKTQAGSSKQSSSGNSRRYRRKSSNADKKMSVAISEVLVDDLDSPPKPEGGYALFCDVIAPLVKPLIMNTMTKSTKVKTKTKTRYGDDSEGEEDTEEARIAAETEVTTSTRRQVLALWYAGPNRARQEYEKLAINEANKLLALPAPVTTMEEVLALDEGIGAAYCAADDDMCPVGSERQCRWMQHSMFCGNIFLSAHELAFHCARDHFNSTRRRSDKLVCRWLGCPHYDMRVFSSEERLEAHVRLVHRPLELPMNKKIAREQANKLYYSGIAASCNKDAASSSESAAIIDDFERAGPHTPGLADILNANSELVTPLTHHQEYIAFRKHLRTASVSMNNKNIDIELRHHHNTHGKLDHDVHANKRTKLHGALHQWGNALINGKDLE